MSLPKITITIVTLSLAAACDAPSTQHSTQAAGHSAAATSHGVTAAAMSGATVLAVPLVVGGASMAVTGAALESAGIASMQGGADVLNATVGTQPPCEFHDANGVCIIPNAAPAL